MRRDLRHCCLALILGVPSALGAQDVTGSWQGTLVVEGGRLPLLLEIGRTRDGQLSAVLFSLAQGGFSAPLTGVAASFAQGRLAASFVPGDIAGTLSANGDSLLATWTQVVSGRPAMPDSITFLRPTAASAWRDSAAHRVRFVGVAADVRLEVLDWGGRGRPVVLLAGLGNNAHVFDAFAPTLTDRYHVYGISRRGLPPSSVAATGYRADTLADDVLAVLDSLHLVRPVLVGHSIAGEELSSIGMRHPERVAGLVYLDAGYSYAFHDPAVPTVGTPTRPPPMAGAREDRVAAAILSGEQRFTKIQGPVLAIYAAPAVIPRDVANDSVSRAKADSASLADRMPYIAAFRRGVPQARVVVLARADHYVFRSNEAEVRREIRAFIDALPARR